MCGITGKIYFSPEKRVTEEEIRRMNELIRHRGPDDEGLYINPRGNVGFGHRRLSVIDLSSAGHQPMSNEDGTVWIIFNGEIYNFQSLRPELEERGHKFKSNTDTEVILHLWEEYGEECLRHLRGMFAFAIWDERKRKLFLARDRVGKKPLKYYIGKDFLVFASELKAFIDDPAIPRKIDNEAIHHYLTFQYIPHPLTGFKDVKKLPPAHYLVVDLSKQEPKIETKRYWRLDYSEKLTLGESEWVNLILDKLGESVKMRMIADVPLGVFLSGGVDSSTIVALMAKNSDRPVKTFSIGFSEEEFNELPYARIVARRYSTEHNEFTVEPQATQMLPKLVYQYEEPYADPSALPTFYLSEMTRQHVTVALNGDGGDENFAGYRWYPVLRFASRYQKLPRLLKRAAAASVESAYRLTPASKHLRYGSILARELLKSIPRLHTEYLAYFTESEKQNLYSKDFLELSRGFSVSSEFLGRRYDETQNLDVVDQALYTDINTYLSDALMVKVDIASMTYSLETRSPLLDHEFLELSAKIPADLKLKDGGKYIFKKAVKGILPAEIIEHKKHGFSLPLDKWFRDELKSYAREILLDSQVTSKNFLNPAGIESLLSSHIKNKADNGKRIWSLITLEFWLRQFFK